MTYLQMLQIYFAILNAADGWTTWQVIRFGGREVGAPKFLLQYFKLYDVLLVLKIGIVIGVWLYVKDWRVVALADIGYTGLVVHNWQQLQIQKAKKNG